MSFAVRQAWESDLDALVACAVSAQADVERFCCYLGDDADSIRADLLTIEGSESWMAATTVALDDDRRVLGWIAAESDPEMGRVWWWGPFLADQIGSLSDVIADALFGTASAALDTFGEHELAVDERSDVLRRFGARHGFAECESSVALRSDRIPDVVVPTGLVIDGLSPAHADAVASLHDALFPGTHTTGVRLVGRTGADLDRFVATEDGVVAGYVATERQNDGSLYIDYLGVMPDRRQRGTGRALIATAIGYRPDATFAHLTVSASNAAARALYGSLGFVEDRVLLPLRRGFA